MKDRRNPVKKILKWIGIVVGVLIFALYIGLPVGIGIYTILPKRAAVGSAPDGFEDVALQTEDGVQLRGWYRPPANGAVVILLHGAGGSRESVRSYADMLVGHGYGVLALDLRGHGESQGKTNRLGWQGSKDVGAAVKFLGEQAEVQAIGGMGLSMGGEVLLGAASQYPQIQAIVTDGASRRCLQEYLALESNRPLARSFTTRVMYATVDLLSGEEAPEPLLDSMVESGSTRFFLIAAGNNTLEIDFNRLFAQTLASRAALWVAPGVSHTAAIAAYPAEYEQRLIDFFDAELKGR